MVNLQDDMHERVLALFEPAPTFSELTPKAALLAMRHHHHAKKATQQNQSDELNDLTERRDELNTEISDIAKEMEKLGDEIIELARRRGKTNPEKAPQTPPGTTPPRFPE